MQRGMAPIYILIVGLVVFILVGGSYLLGKQNTSTSPEEKACTMDAKICPDGSSVGRVGPDCEFAPCPSVSPSPTPDETSKFKDDSSSRVCAQVITPAKNIQTGQCQTFSNSCIPEGWVVDRTNCQVDI